MTVDVVASHSISDFCTHFTWFGCRQPEKKLKKSVWRESERGRKNPCLLCVLLHVGNVVFEFRNIKRRYFLDTHTYLTHAGGGSLYRWLPSIRYCIWNDRPSDRQNYYFISFRQYIIWYVRFPIEFRSLFVGNLIGNFIVVVRQRPDTLVVSIRYTLDKPKINKYQESKRKSSVRHFAGRQHFNFAKHIFAEIAYWIFSHSPEQWMEPVSAVLARSARSNEIQMTLQFFNLPIASGRRIFFFVNVWTLFYSPFVASASEPKKIVIK